MSPLPRFSRWVFQPKKFHSSQIKSLSSISTHSGDLLPSPPPIRVGLTESAGRGVIATRSIGTGELIHTAKPVVSHPSLSSIQSVCYLCLRKLSFRNDGSGYASFCSKQCEEQSKKFYEVEKKADWSNFDEYCQIQGLKYPLLIKRLTCQILSGAVSPDILDILQPEIPSSEKISMMQNEFRLLRSIFEATSIESEAMSFLTEKWYINVLSRMRINSFRIELVGGSYEDLLSSASASVDTEAAVGNAVYMLPSLYNHDCDPNVNILWIDNVDAKLKALRDIEEGEELRICYIDASMDYDARQTILYRGFGFRCNCPRCMWKE